MRFDIEPDVFGNPKNAQLLLGLIERATSGKFFFSVGDDTAAPYTKWADGLDRGVRSAWDRMKEWAEQEMASRRLASAKVRDIKESDWSTSDLTLKDALWLSDLPYQIILENGRNDRAFLLAMMPREDRGFLERLEKNGRLIFRGVGGIGEIKKTIEDDIANKKERRQIYYALFDSDAHRSNKNSKEANAAIAACKAAIIEHYCLERRAIENYLPKASLEDFSRSSARIFRDERLALVEALYALSPEQRNHFRMKSGLPAQIHNDDERELFSDVTGAERVTLSGGFSDDLADHYSLADPGRLWRQILQDGSRNELNRTSNYLMSVLGAPHNA